MVSYELQNYEREIKQLSIKTMRMRANILPELIKKRETAQVSLQAYLNLLAGVERASSSIDDLIGTIKEYLSDIRATSYNPRFGQTKQHWHGKIGSLNDTLTRQLPYLKSLKRDLDIFKKSTVEKMTSAEEKEKMELLSTIEVKTDPYEHFQEQVQSFDLLVATVYLLIKIMRKK